jgi:hypothetical protein
LVQAILSTLEITFSYRRINLQCCIYKQQIELSISIFERCAKPEAQSTNP